MKLIQRFGAILLIIAATFVVYAPALRNGFVWDDTALVLRDPLIRSWRLIPEGFRHFLFLDATGSNFYRPLQRLTYVADYTAWGLEHPSGWHLTSIAIHAAAAVMFFIFLRRWWGLSRQWWALLVALLWTIHPLHTSAVTYVSGRADLLAALFGFGGLTLTVASIQNERRARILRCVAAGCFLAAFLSKESGGIFLAIAAALLAWHRIPWRQCAHWTMLGVVVLGAYSTLRYSAHKTPPPPRLATGDGEPIAVIAARAASEYASLIVAPLSLRMERDVRLSRGGSANRSAGEVDLRRLQAAGGTVLGLLFLGWLGWSWRREPDSAFCLLGFSIAYLPISNLIPLNATVAEHWLYVPSAFLFAAATLSLGRLTIARAPLLVVLAVWGAALAARTWLRQADWRDQRTFLLRTIEEGGDSARMRVNLGNLAMADGRIEDAIEQYDEALAKQASLGFAHVGMATAQLKLKNYDLARHHLDRAETVPGLAAEKLQLRTALDAAEKEIDPLPGFKAAANHTPLNWPLRKRYLTALAATGRLPEAIRDLRAFLQEQDFRADSWLLLADFLSRVGETELATVAREEAYRRDIRLRSSGKNAPPAV